MEQLWKWERLTAAAAIPAASVAAASIAATAAAVLPEIAATEAVAASAATGLAAAKATVAGSHAVEPSGHLLVCFLQEISPVSSAAIILPHHSSQKLTQRESTGNLFATAMLRIYHDWAICKPPA